MTLLVRTAGDPALLVSALREEIRAFAPSLPPPSVHTFRQHLRLAMLPQQIAAILLSALGLLAVTIALVGLYGIVAFDVAQRAREFGIRMALGAAATDVRRLVLANALRLVGIGILCGAPIAIAGAFMIRAFLMVPPVDPVAFLGVPFLLVLSAVVASYVPARRATAQDPAQTLRAH
jgi:ABC-type antimicrobial peptide transport system permease subunit